MSQIRFLPGLRPRPSSRLGRGIPLDTYGVSISRLWSSPSSLYPKFQGLALLIVSSILCFIFVVVIILVVVSRFRPRRCSAGVSILQSAMATKMTAETEV